MSKKIFREGDRVAFNDNGKRIRGTVQYARDYWYANAVDLQVLKIQRDDDDETVFLLSEDCKRLRPKTIAWPGAF